MLDVTLIQFYKCYSSTDRGSVEKSIQLKLKYMTHKMCISNPRFCQTTFVASVIPNTHCLALCSCQNSCCMSNKLHCCIEISLRVNNSLMNFINIFLLQQNSGLRLYCHVRRSRIYQVVKYRTPMSKEDLLQFNISPS